MQDELPRPDQVGNPIRRLLTACATLILLQGCGGDRPSGYYQAPPLGPAATADKADAALSTSVPRERDANNALSRPEVGPSSGAGSERPAVVAHDNADTPRGDADVGPTPDADAGPTPDVDVEAVPPDSADAADAGESDAGPQAAPIPPTMPLPNFASLFKKLSPSVVNIYTSEEVRRRLPGRWPARRDRGTSLGSGLIYSADGQILTNAHVVENAAEIRVRFHDREELPARLVGIDPVRDLALLKVDGRNDLVPVVPGDSSKVSVGDWVLAIGNPFGLSHTLTKGIVSAKGRVEFVSETMGYMDLIQTDAAINEGNSGGPLFDLRGHVVGVATAVSAEGQGISFAIPWSQVKDALPRLEQGGQVSRSWLGIYLRSTDPNARISKDVPRGGGVLVAGIVDDSPAAKAMLEPGDVIVRFGGRPVNSINEFRLSVASSVAGKPVTLTLYRAGVRKVVKVTLREAR